MAGNGDRGGLLSAGGILSIVVGVLEALGGGGLAAVSVLKYPLWEKDLPLLPRLDTLIADIPEATPLFIAGIVLLVLGVMAIGGGISALKRSSYGLALVGALCAFLPMNALGLLALIFVSLASGEFGAKDA